MKELLLAATCFATLVAHAQKKPLDHTVYDGWQSIADRAISNDGQYVTYAVNPQEGDGVLVIQAAAGSYKKEIPRGYNAAFSQDSRFVVCHIRPPFTDTREARIKKKKADDMPKDSLAIITLGKDALVKIPRVKSYKLPDESGLWLACLLEKTLPETVKPPQPDSLTRLNSMLEMADSLVRAADSIRNNATNARLKGMIVLQQGKQQSPATLKATEEAVEEGTDLLLKNLITGETRTFKLVSEFFFNKKGNILLIETTKKNNDSLAKASIVRIDLNNNKTQTILSGFNDAKGYRLDEAGKQLAFVAERDSSSKSLQKFYKLYYHKEGADSAVMVADCNTKGLPGKWTVSDNPNISFSKSGARLFFGTSPVLPVKDTTLPDFERVNVDVWHYNDDYIQPVQLKNLDNELKRSFMARIDLAGKQIVQLGTDQFRNIVTTNEGDGPMFYASSDFGKRVAIQWQGFSFNDVYSINPENGEKMLIRKDLKGSILQPSASGNYLLFFDERKQAYFVYNVAGKQLYPVAKDIKTALYNEDNDVPDDANAYGVVKWMEYDKYVLIYDKYDIWQVDPEGKERSVCLTNGRKDKVQARYVATDPDEHFIKAGQKMLLRLFDEKDKSSGLAVLDLDKHHTAVLFKEPVSVGAMIQKAKDAVVLTYTKESYRHSPDVYVQSFTPGSAVQLSRTNPQQANYHWGTAELFKWKAYTGKETEGVLYKPEEFDHNKKYPMIVYFYERNNNTLHNYIAPSPTPSRLNISFFVSRGYIVFVPDIWYKTGYPGQSAYDYILSGTRAIVKQGYVDSTKIGLQGQSWGGYQIAYLITRTNLYAAAWAGAPVANMTSAYGGIRWGTGLNRQFQYEKTQSRIGATLWEKPNLYIQNSALFSLLKVTTPLVIMANDADDAVPWYQGIEMYTGMRRLGKKVWMLNYNNEAHNLVERKNRKDIQIREQQFFDFLLKGEKPAKWIAEGLPAIRKGRDWGLGY